MPSVFSPDNRGADFLHPFRIAGSELSPPETLLKPYPRFPSRPPPTLRTHIHAPRPASKAPRLQPKPPPVPHEIDVHHLLRTKDGRLVERELADRIQVQPVEVVGSRRGADVGGCHSGGGGLDREGGAVERGGAAKVRGGLHLCGGGESMTCEVGVSVTVHASQHARVALLPLRTFVIAQVRTEIRTRSAGLALAPESVK